MESCGTLLTPDLKRNLFNLFASWSGLFAKPLGIVYHTYGTNNIDNEKLQYSALQVGSKDKIQLTIISNIHIYLPGYVRIIVLWTMF